MTHQPDDNTIFSTVCYTRQISHEAVYQTAFALEWCESCRAAHVTIFQNWGTVIPQAWFNTRTPAPAPNRFKHPTRTI